MYRSKTLIITLLILFLTTACSKNIIYSQDMIRGSLDEINSAQVSINTEDSIETSNREVINGLIEAFTDLELKELSEQEELALFQNNQIEYTLILLSDLRIVGMIMIYSNGDIVFADTDTLYENRTKSYIHRNLSNEKLNKIDTEIERIK